MNDIEKMLDDERRLEREIFEKVSPLLEEFESKWGFYPRDVNIDIREVTSIGDKKRQFRLVKAYVETNPAILK